MWVKVNTPAKLDKIDKENLRNIVDKYIKSNDRLCKKVNRIDIKAGRIYLYTLYEPSINPKHGTFIGKLIDEKYLEEILGRITLYDNQGKNCSIGWKRYNDKWMELSEGSLEYSLKFIAENEEWF